VGYDATASVFAWLLPEDSDQPEFYSIGEWYEEAERQDDALVKLMHQSTREALLRRKWVGEFEY